MKPQPPLKGVEGFRRPFAGAWIETDRGDEQRLKNEVAPSRGRGLKLFADR